VNVLEIRVIMYKEKCKGAKGGGNGDYVAGEEARERRSLAI
jgi:hypothetical protein